MVARTSAPDKHMVRGHSLVPSVAHTFHLAQSAWQRKKGKADLYEAFDGNSDRRTLTLVLTMYTISVRGGRGDCRHREKWMKQVHKPRRHYGIHGRAKEKQNYCERKNRKPKSGWRVKRASKRQRQKNAEEPLINSRAEGSISWND